MTIQWSLVLFTVLSGCGAGLFACTALDEFRGGAASKVRLPACAVAVALLVVGWMSKTLVHVGVGLCALYCVTVVMMLVFQRHPEQRWREVADVLEELTTTWYFGAALIVLWLLSRVLENNFLLAIAGLAILAGPAVVSLLAKDKKLHHLTSKHRVRR